MAYLQKLIDLGRQHYEKLILILALLGLGVTVWILNKVRVNEAEKTANFLRNMDQTTNRPLTVVNLSLYERVVQQAEQPLDLSFTLPHNLVNPVTWQRQRNGDLLKIETGGEVGPAVLEYTQAKPLRFILALERTTTSGYLVSITRETLDNPRLRKRLAYASVGQTNDAFALLEVKGDAKEPTELVLELVGTQEKVSIGPGKPFTRTDGFEADLKYPPENQSFANSRVGTVLRFAGDEYKIVAITADEIVLSAGSNNKKYTVRRKQP